MNTANRIPLSIAIPFLAAVLVAGPACESSGPASNWALSAKRSPPEPPS